MTITAAPVQQHSKLRNSVALIIGAIVVALAAMLTFAFTEERSEQNYAPNNSNPDGSMALGNLLKDAGVRVEYVTTTAHALAAVTEESTLVIVRGAALLDHQSEAIAEIQADVVMVGTHVEALGPWRMARVATRGTVEPQCANPDAMAAGPLTLGGRGVDTAEGCYLTEEGALLATAPHGGHTVTYLADARIIQNSDLAVDGNAALAMRLFGKHDHVVWYIPSSHDQFTTDDPTAMPPLYTALIMFSLVMATTLWIWKGRRLGPVVVEPLPVQVPAAETTRGLGNLYQVNQDRGHALQVLRAGTILTISRPLGLTPTSSPHEVLSAVQQKTGHHPEDVQALLYGPSPTSDEDFLNLSQRLAMLENEV